MEQTNTNTGNGGEPSTDTILDRTNKAIQRLEETEKRVNEKLESLARAKLGGQSLAGSPQEPVVETPRDYANKILSGKK